jgi:hypothetical protein
MAATNVQAFSGDITQGGQVLYPQKRWEIDLTSDTTTARFYPIYFDTATAPAGLGEHWPINFKVFGDSLGGGDSFNEETLIGYARGGGYSDHRGMCKVHSNRFVGGELRFQGIWRGYSSVYGFAIYMRGGYKYSILTDASTVVENKAAYTVATTTYAVKDAAGSDVVGTSANISEMVDMNDFAQTGENTATTGNFILPTSQARLGIGTDTPAFSGLNLYTQDEIISMKSTRGENPEIKIGWSGTSAENFYFYDVDGSGTGFLYGRKYTTGTSANSNAGWKFYGNDNTLALSIAGTTSDVSIATQLYQGGQKVINERRWEIDFTSGTTARFYPVLLFCDPQPADGLGALPPVTFRITGACLGGGDDFNEDTIIGYGRGGGATDHRGFAEAQNVRYNQAEYRCQGIWEGTNEQNIICLYMRGNYKYTLITDAVNVVTSLTVKQVGNSTFALKNYLGVDAYGTSNGIGELLRLSTNTIEHTMLQRNGSMCLPASSAKLGVGLPNPTFAIQSNLLPVKFGGVTFRSGGGGTPNQVHNTGINMNAYGAGGTVLFFFLFHDNSGDSTRSDVYILRKNYNGTWTSDSTSVHTIVSMRGTGQSGTVTFGQVSNHLTMSYSNGGQQGWYSIDFE